MRLFFGGAEAPSWRKLLTEEHVPDMAMSYVGLAKRVKFARPWLVAGKFPADVNVLLDSGAMSLADVPDDEQVQLADDYLTFVEKNIEHLAYVVEMDAPGLHANQVAVHREDLYRIAGEKMIVVWHEGDGTTELELLASNWPRVAVTSTTVAGRDISPLLRRIAGDGVDLFGSGMLKAEALTQIPWHAVLGTSWISPSRFGETVLWSRGQLHQFHKREKESARRRYRPDIEALGINHALIMADDRTENLRLSIRSWNRQLAAVNQLATNRAEMAIPENGVPAVPAVDNPLPAMRHGLATVRPSVALPGTLVEAGSEPWTDPDTGARMSRAIPLLRRDPAPIRACSNCRLAEICPSFEADARCVYEIPIELGSAAQVEALALTVLGMQAEQLLRQKFEYELEGGHDSARYERQLAATFAMIQKYQAMQETGFSLTIKTTGSPNTDGGIMSRIFGRDPGPRAIAPIASNNVLDALGVEDAELVETDA
jgi:hypothetical protein